MSNSSRERVCGGGTCEECGTFKDIGHKPGCSKLSSPAGETPAMRQHKWNKDGERCEECGDKDWMGGPCRVTEPVPTGGAAEPNPEVGQVWRAPNGIEYRAIQFLGTPGRWLFQCVSDRTLGTATLDSAWKLLAHPSAPEAAAAGEERICAECKATLRRRAHFWEDHKGLAHHYCGGDINQWQLHVAAPIAPAAVSKGFAEWWGEGGASGPEAEMVRFWCQSAWEAGVSSQTASAEGDGWIAVTPETMPQVGVEILFNVPHCYGVEKGIYVGDRWVSDRTSSYNDEVSFTSEEITHWRPLPAPPVNEETK